MVRRLLLLILTFALPVAGAVLVAPAADAHPAGAHDRVVEAEPAAVYIETAVTAQVVLHDMGKPVFLQLRTYDEPPLSTGTGVVVSQTGTVVTAASVVSPPLDQARNYAVNQMFSAYYKVSVPGDPFMRHQLSDPTLNKDLQNCYDTHELYMQGATCVVSMTTKYRVFPFVTKPTSGGLPADVLRAGSGAQDVAVLAVNASNAPTAALAPALGNAGPVSTIGFTGRPNASSQPVTADEHLKPPGTAHFTAADFATVRNGVGAKTAGLPVISADSGAVVGIVSGAGDGTIIPAERITAALRSLGIRPSRSVVDAAFADATAFYSAQHYTHAVPRLQEVLRLDPQNAVAAQMLQTALAKRGTAADKSNQGMGGMNMGGASSSGATTSGTTGNGGGVSGWLIALYVGLGVLVLAVIATYAFGRRLTGGGKIVRRRKGPQAPAAPAAAYVTEAPAPAGNGESRPPGSVGGSLPAPRRDGDLPSLTVQRPRPPMASTGDATPGVVTSGGPTSAAAPQRTAGAASNPQRTVGAASAGTIAARRFCTQCGTQLASHHRFCGMCGKAVE